jgi:hypothetical protein
MTTGLLFFMLLLEKKLNSTGFFMDGEEAERRLTISRGDSWTRRAATSIARSGQELFEALMMAAFTPHRDKSLK